MKPLPALTALFLIVLLSAPPVPAGDPAVIDNASYVPIASPRGKSNEFSVRPVLPVKFRYTPAEFDIPIELNGAVWGQLMQLQRANGKGVRISLERGGFFLEEMRSILWEEGCPRDMAYLAMIESDFQPTARSVVDAAGMWQFMESTGEKYGLTINDWMDERLDVEKSAHAAARFLMDLYDQFESWPLAIAAYNAGPGAISRAIKRRKTSDFWKLAKYSDLKEQTRNFVPKFYASLIIAKHPERFGITGIEPMAPHRAVKVSVPPLTDMLTISKLSGAPYEQIVDLNAQYLYESVPPYDGPWEVRVPKKYADGLQAKIDQIKEEDRNVFVVHKARRGESVYSLSRMYHIPSRVIMDANGLKSAHLKSGTLVVVPRRTTGPPKRVTLEPEVRKVDGKYKVRYTVGKGDSLWGIARKADAHIEEVCKWNSIKKEDPIYPGQRLTLYCADGATARRVGREGAKNRSKTLSPTPNPRATYHTVRAGESLSRIATRYGVTVDQIVGWNHLKDPDHIRPGQKLKIYR